MTDQRFDEDEKLRIFAEAFAADESGDLKRAMKLYTDLAERDFTPAQTNLGNIYDDRLVPPRPRKAIYWYKRAVELNSPAGAWCLAIHYRNLGKKRPYHYWLRRAAAMGDEDAMEGLSKLKSPRRETKRQG